MGHLYIIRYFEDYNIKYYSRRGYIINPRYVKRLYRLFLLFTDSLTCGTNVICHFSKTISRVVYIVFSSLRCKIVSFIGDAVKYTTNNS
jgi:hypothetical protein